MLKNSTLKFLKDLKKNNNKPWFDAHRDAYEAARDDFAHFIQAVLDKHSNNDPDLKGLTAKQCMFRINRDIRFSKDKSPYKAHFGASIKRGGKKSLYAGYYFHLEPGKSFAGGGLWHPEVGQLKNVRQEIDYNWNEFSNILKQKTFRSTFHDLYMGADEQLSTMPKGYGKDNPAASYLRLKSFIAETRFDDAELSTSSLHKGTIQAFKAIKPFLDFLNRTVEE